METPGRGPIRMFSFCSKKSRRFQTRILRDNPVLLAFRALVQTSSTLRAPGPGPRAGRPGRFLSGRCACGQRGQAGGRRLLRDTAASSGDDVRGDLIFDEGDAVAQQQLAFLQTLQSEQIGSGRLVKCIDCCIEIAVLLLQPGKFGLEFALIFVGHDVFN